MNSQNSGRHSRKINRAWKWIASLFLQLIGQSIYNRLEQPCIDATLDSGQYLCDALTAARDVVPNGHYVQAAAMYPEYSMLPQPAPTPLPSSSTTATTTTTPMPDSALLQAGRLA